MEMKKLKTVGKRPDGEKVKLAVPLGKIRHIDEASEITFFSKFECGNLAVVLQNDRVATAVSKQSRANLLLFVRTSEDSVRQIMASIVSRQRTTSTNRARPKAGSISKCLGSPS